MSNKRNKRNKPRNEPRNEPINEAKVVREMQDKLIASKEQAMKDMSDTADAGEKEATAEKVDVEKEVALSQDSSEEKLNEELGAEESPEFDSKPEEPVKDESEAETKKEAPASEEAETKKEAPAKEEAEPKKHRQGKDEGEISEKERHLRSFFKDYTTVMATNTNTTNKGVLVRQHDKQRGFVDLIMSTLASSNGVAGIKSIMKHMKDNPLFSMVYATRYIHDINLVRVLSEDYELSIALLINATNNGIEHTRESMDIPRILSKITDKQVVRTLDQLFG